MVGAQPGADLGNCLMGVFSSSTAGRTAHALTQARPHMTYNLLVMVIHVNEPGEVFKYEDPGCAFCSRYRNITKPPSLRAVLRPHRPRKSQGKFGFQHFSDIPDDECFSAFPVRELCFPVSL